MLTRPTPKRVQTDQAVNLDRLLRQRIQTDQFNRTIGGLPRNLFELDNVNAFQADDGHHLAYNYASGKHELRRRQFVFTAPGPLVTGQSTTPLDLDYNGILQQLRIRLGTAGSSTSIIILQLNGSNIATATLGSGVPSVTVTLGSRVRVTTGDLLVATINTAGTAAQNMTGSITI